MKEDELSKIIRKEETLISCDHEECEVYGTMYFCYMNNQRRCGLYTEWERKLISKQTKHL